MRQQKDKKADGEKPDSKICTYFNQTLEINLTRYDKITETLLNPFNIDGMKCSILDLLKKKKLKGMNEIS